MYIARILYPVKVLGPGNRIAIWMAGCEHQCKGCSNPELWFQEEKQSISLNEIRSVIHALCNNYNVDGFTLTGGDPFFQPNALRELLPYLFTINKDILVYTGYQYEELKDRYEDIFKYITVLIDGKYKESENHGAVLIGSDNQQILYLDSSAKSKYQAYLRQTTSKIQNFDTSDGIISVGIHLPGFEQRLKSKAKDKGLKEHL